MAEVDPDERPVKIKNLIEAFCDEHLNAEFVAYALKLCDTVRQEPRHTITRGKPEIWAASIVYVIARLNFLFDPENMYFMSADTINDFFGTKKSTVANKASTIEKICKIGIGTEGYCSREISDSLTLVELPNGFIMPKKSLTNRDIIVESVDGEEAEELERFMAERKHLKEQQEEEKKERITERNRKIAEAKRKEKNKNQLGLFDDNDA